MRSSTLFATALAAPIQTPAEMTRTLIEDGRVNGDIIRAANVKIDRGRSM